MNSTRPMPAISLRRNVYEMIKSVRDEITMTRKKIDKHSREATFSEAVWAICKESGRVPSK